MDLAGLSHHSLPPHLAPACHYSGCDIKSWTEQAAGRSRRPCRVFVLEGEEADILAAITIMTAAIDRYKDLCEGRCCGQAVGRVQRIMGVEFSYQVRGGGAGGRVWSGGEEQEGKGEGKEGKGGEGEGKKEEGRGRRAWREGKCVCEGRCCSQAVGRVQWAMGLKFSYQVRGEGRVIRRRVREGR